MEKNANNKVKRWRLELATYNTNSDWISGAHNKAADCLSRLTELPLNRPATANPDGPAFHTRSRTSQHTSTEDTTSQPQSDADTPDDTDTTSTTSKSMTMDR